MSNEYFQLPIQRNGSKVKCLQQRSLKLNKEKLAGISVGNPQRETVRPTTELLLAAFKEITSRID
jgi:hypothetical protein